MFCLGLDLLIPVIDSFLGLGRFGASSGGYGALPRTGGTGFPPRPVARGDARPEQARDARSRVRQTHGGCGGPDPLVSARHRAALVCNKPSALGGSGKLGVAPGLGGDGFRGVCLRCQFVAPFVGPHDEALEGRLPVSGFVGLFPAVGVYVPVAQGSVHQVREFAGYREGRPPCSPCSMPDGGTPPPTRPWCAGARPPLA